MWPGRNALWIITWTYIWPLKRNAIQNKSMLSPGHIPWRPPCDQLIVADHKDPSGRLRLKTGLVCCGHIPSGRATSLYRWLCLGRETLAQPTQVSRKFSTKNRSYSHNWLESDLRVSQVGCASVLWTAAHTQRNYGYKLVVRHSHEWRKSVAQPAQPRKTVAVANRSQRDLRSVSHVSPRPATSNFWLHNLYKTSKTWKTNVRRSHIGLAIDTNFWSFSGRREVLYGMWPGLYTILRVRCPFFYFCEWSLPIFVSSHCL